MSAFEYKFSVVNKDTMQGLHSQGNYSASNIISKYSKLVPNIMRNLKAVGIRPEVFHNEVDPFNCEITHSPGFGISGADNAVTFKKVVKETCQDNDLSALFITRPFKTSSDGNFGQFNASVWDKEGQNVFYDPNIENNISKLALNWIGGLQEHFQALVCLSTPTYNCYQLDQGAIRLTPKHNL